MTIPVDDACCYRTLEIVYGNGALSAAMTTEMADTVNGRLVKAATRRQELQEPRLVNGILEFHQKVGGRDQIVEVTLDQEGRALVRSHMVQPDHNWTPMPRLR